MRGRRASVRAPAPEHGRSRAETPRKAWLLRTSAVHLAEHDIDRAEDRDHVADLLADERFLKDREIDEARRAHVHSHRAHVAVGDHVDAEIAARALDVGVRLARQGLWDLRDALGRYVPLLHLFEALLDDLHRLAHLAHAAVVPIPAGTVLAERHFELDFVVETIWLELARVVVDARAAQIRSGESPGDRILGRQEADGLGPVD